MNKTAIEWCTHSWNPMTGCLHGCPYCYAKKIAERFKGSKAWPNGFQPMFHPERLLEPQHLKKPAIIFAGSMTDVFGDWWNPAYINDLLAVMRGGIHHRFIVLTKNPSRMLTVLKTVTGDLSHLQHIYFGTSVTGCPPENDFNTEKERIDTLGKVHRMGFKTVISFEPLLHDPVLLLKSVGRMSDVADWVIIGYQTNPVKIPPSQSKCAIRDYVVFDCGIPLFIKNSAIAKDCERRNPCDEWGNAGTHWWPADLSSIAQSWGKG